MGWLREKKLRVIFSVKKLIILTVNIYKKKYCTEVTLERIYIIHMLHKFGGRNGIYQSYFVCNLIWFDKAQNSWIY